MVIPEHKYIRHRENGKDPGTLNTATIFATGSVLQLALHLRIRSVPIDHFRENEGLTKELATRTVVKRAEDVRYTEAKVTPSEFSDRRGSGMNKRFSVLIAAEECSWRH